MKKRTKKLLLAANIGWHVIQQARTLISAQEQKFFGSFFKKELFFFYYQRLPWTISHQAGNPCAQQLFSYPEAARVVDAAEIHRALSAAFGDPEDLAPIAEAN